VQGLCAIVHIFLFFIEFLSFYLHITRDKNDLAKAALIDPTRTARAAELSCVTDRLMD